MLLERLAGHDPQVDGGGNIVVRLVGREPGPLRAVLAHKDEIGALVKRIDEDGRLHCQTLGDAHPWIWGEGPVDVIGRNETVLGVLSFGARHVSEESPQRKQLDDTPLRWRDAWVETKRSGEALAEAGVTAGTRVVPTRSRKPPVRLGDGGEYVAAYALDDRAAVAALLMLAERLEPLHDVELVFTAREEIGCSRRPVVCAAHGCRGCGCPRGCARGQGVRARPRAVAGDHPRRQQRPAGRRDLGRAGGRGAGRRLPRAPGRGQPLRVGRVHRAGHRPRRAQPAWASPPRTRTASRSPTWTPSGPAWMCSTAGSREPVATGR